MSGTSVSLTPEQQELLDSGLSMLAHMIVETHLHRTSPNKASGEAATREKSGRERAERTRAESPDENQLESDHE